MSPSFLSDPAGRPGRSRFGSRAAAGCALALLAAVPTAAATFDVTPASNLQSVIDSAGANADAINTIRFAAGTYNITTVLMVGSAFANRTLVLESTSGATGTILDGGGTSGILWAQGGASGGHVILDGLTLRNGDDVAGAGGALLTQWTELTVRNCVLSNNRAANKGGAIAVEGSGSQRDTVLLHVENSTLSDNTSSGDGGAIQVTATSAELIGSTFVRNRATGVTNGLANNPRGAGGAILATQSGTLTVDGSDFIDNKSEFAGGAVSIFDTHGTITNGTFTGNESIRDIVDINKGDGGAVHCETGGSAKTFLIQNNTMTNNEAGGKGGAIHVFAQTTASTVDILDNTMASNTALLGGAIGNFDLSGGNSVQTIRDNVIDSNAANERYGGVIVAFAGDLLFEGNEVKANTAAINHPGLYVEGTECALIQRNEFRSNINNGSSTLRDGALRLKNLRPCPSSSLSALVENNFFYDGRGVHAAAVLAGGQTTDVIGNTFLDNRVTDPQGGDVWMTSSGKFRSNIFAQHGGAVTDAYGIRISDPAGVAAIEVFFNDFHQNQIGLVRDPDNRLGGDGNFTTVGELNAAAMAGSNLASNPSFVSPGTGDLHLRSGSTLIDQGDCPLFSTPKIDIDGETRPAGADCDMGADEVVTFTLTVTKAGSGSGTVTSSPAGVNCGGDCSESYAGGTVVTLTPGPAAGSAFAGWSGDADCADGQVTMSGARSCTATFVLLRTLDVNKVGGGTGLVMSSPGGINCGGDCSEDYVEGTAVDLDVVPDFGSEFGGFSGPSDCSDGSLGMTFDVTCTAAFDACSSPSEVNLPPQDVSGSPNDFEACNKLTAGAGTGGFNVLAGATATFRAGNEIVLENGFTAGLGVDFTLTIGPP